MFSVGGGSREHQISMSLVNAIELAREVGALVVAVVGKDDGAAATLADHCIVVRGAPPERLTPAHRGLPGGRLAPAGLAPGARDARGHLGGHRPRRGDPGILSSTADRAVFLDRDGIINELVLNSATGDYESPYRPEDVALTAGAVEAIRILRAHDVAVAVVSNQPAAAKGTTTIADLMLVHEAVIGLLADAGVGVDDVRYCFHHPEGAHPDLGRVCDCRKPLPGLIHQAAAALGLDGTALGRSWLIGDSDVDVEAGQRAGCRTVLVEEPRSSHRRHGATADARAADVLEAVLIVAAALPAHIPGEETR